MKDLKLKYGERWSSKSTNICIIEVYEFIVKNENVDSDFWNEDVGTFELIEIVNDCFTTYDWQELKKDLTFWTNSQLEILIYCLMNGYGMYISQSYRSNIEVTEKTKSIPKRMELIIPILEIGNERSKIENDIILTVMENLDFITDHFDLLINVDLENLNKIRTISEIIGIDYVNAEYPNLISKMEIACR